MRFPQDLLRFLYFIFFKPSSLQKRINQVDSTIMTAGFLLSRPHSRSAGALKSLALFYILVVPWLLGLGTGMFLYRLGMDVNWLKLTLYLCVAITLGLTFSMGFCLAFLLPFSVAAAVWSSASFTPMLGVVFSLILGLAYGLRPNNARWGLTAGFVYGTVFGLILDPLSGLIIGAAFWIGYFRIVFYLMEAPLSWILAALVTQRDALSLWRFNPVLWDELIWFPLPGLDRHLLAIKGQDDAAFRKSLFHVQESFRQGWAAERATTSK